VAERRVRLALLSEVAREEVAQHHSQRDARLEEAHPEGAERRDRELVHPHRQVDEHARLRSVCEREGRGERSERRELGRASEAKGESEGERSKRKERVRPGERSERRERRE
jgi:hypothetical protein